MSTKTTTYITRGLGYGSILAMIASWDHNHSLLWAALHGFCSWFYVAYYALAF
jgi:hypothetical protein